MRIQVRLLGVDGTPSIIEYATRQAHRHLSRFGRQVSGVTVRISDVNGPKGGADKRCQLTAAGPRLGSIHLIETHPDVIAGIDLALDRLGRAVGRSVGRARDRHSLGGARSLT